MAMSNAVFIVGEGVGDGAVPLSRFLCVSVFHEVSAASPPSTLLERKTGAAGRKRDRKRGKEKTDKREGRDLRFGRFPRDHLDCL